MRNKIVSFALFRQDYDKINQLSACFWFGKLNKAQVYHFYYCYSFFLNEEVHIVRILCEEKRKKGKQLILD